MLMVVFKNLLFLLKKINRGLLVYDFFAADLGGYTRYIHESLQYTPGITVLKLPILPLARSNPACASGRVCESRPDALRFSHRGISL